MFTSVTLLSRKYLKIVNIGEVINKKYFLVIVFLSIIDCNEIIKDGNPVIRVNDFNNSFLPVVWWNIEINKHANNCFQMFDDSLIGNIIVDISSSTSQISTISFDKTFADIHKEMTT